LRAIIGKWAPFRTRVMPCQGRAKPAIAPSQPLSLRLPSRYSSANRTVTLMIATNPFLWLIHTVIWLYIYILIATAVLSWLVAFNVVNMRNDIVRSVSYFLYQVTEPALRPIRSVLPNLGGIDISFVILMIGLMFLDQFIIWAYAKIFLGL
jgi:YggT family protein